MNKKIASIVIAFILFLIPMFSMAQQSEPTEIDKLKEEINKLEAIEKDPSTPKEAMSFNQKFLQERRVQLSDLIRKKAMALKQYLLVAATSLTTQENQLITKSINSLEDELRVLDSKVVKKIPIPQPPNIVALNVPVSYKLSTEAQMEGNAIGSNQDLVEPDPTPTPPVECDASLSDLDEVTYSLSQDLGTAINYIDTFNGRINNANNLIKETLYRSSPQVNPSKGDYCIVNIIRWEQYQKDNKYDALRERWFLYKNTGPKGQPQWVEQSDFQGTRIYGSKRVHVLLIHLKAQNTWDINYTVSVKKKLPANVANVLDLLGVVTTPVSKRAADAPEERNLWGGGLMCIKDVPSDISVEGEIVIRDKNRMAVQQPKTYSKTYDNEGRYWWDISVGVPIKEVKEIQFDASDNTVRTKEISRQNAYGFLNIFFPEVDIKSDTYLKYPHFVFGVPLSKKPLDRPIVGLGYGIRKFSLKFDLFAGVVFNKVREPQTLNVGNSATQSQLESDLRTRRVTKFVFGLNFPLRQVKKALSGKE